MGAYDQGSQAAPIGLGSTDARYTGDQDGDDYKVFEHSEHHPLTPEEVRATIQAEINDSIGHLGSDISEQRRRAQQYYKGRLLGNEVEGRSSVVLTDVMDTVEWIMPSLMRMFLGGHIVARYKPVGPEDEDWSKQATDYINEVFFNTQDGFLEMYNFFKTALIEKNAFLKIWYEETFEPKKITYRGLTIDQATLVMQEEGIELLEQNEYPGDMVDPSTMQLDPQTQQPIEGSGQPYTFYDLVVRERKTRGRIKLQGVPPEEVLISRRATRLNDNTPFVGIRTKRTVSELIAMGYDEDLIRHTPSDDSPEFSQERTERFEDENTYPTMTGERADWASREVWVTDCYMRLDEDGDGYSELRHIVVLGEDSMTILSDEEINTIPLVSLTPIPMPYKFFGMSVADQVMDLQQIRSTILRQMLDNLYLINNGRYEVVTGAVEIDDLLTSRPGGIVRVEAPGMIQPLETKPLPPEAFGMLEHLKQIREERTGITRYNQGTDASSLNKTATGMNMIMNAAQARIELIARVFAETGLKYLFKKYLRLIIEQPMKERVFRMNGKWITVDPTKWNEDMDVEIEVGMGPGQAAEKLQALQSLLSVQGELNNAGLGGHLVTPANVYAAVDELTIAMGYKHNKFFTDPTGQEPPEPEPDPRLLAVQQKDAEAKQELEFKEKDRKMDAAEKGAELDLKKMEIEMRREVEMSRIAMEREVRVEVAEINARHRDADHSANGDAREH